MKPTLQEIKPLIESAKVARTKAFASRSEHKIGASVLTTDGQIFSGCNIESNISGLGICAERCAINNAVSRGNYQLKKILVYDVVPQIPCGACLQYVMEFCNKDTLEIISVGKDGQIKKSLLCELLPRGYIGKNRQEKLDRYQK